MADTTPKEQMNKIISTQLNSLINNKEGYNESLLALIGIGEFSRNMLENSGYEITKEEVVKNGKIIDFTLKLKKKRNK